MVSGDSGVRFSIPGYEGFELLGSGGFSRVWKADQPRFRRSVAMKVLNFDIVDERAIQSFERECQAMGQVSVHPNIVTILDSGLTPDDRPFIVMDYYAGGTYADLVDREQIPIDDLLRLGVKISAALQAAHDAGILHRDLKPQNIFISKFNEPALGDFGISTVDSARTATGSAGFTVHYAPPEVLDGRPGTVQSDLYSLGATFYRLVEGIRPFDGPDQTVVATAVRIINEPIPRISRSDCPAELRDLITRLMAKAPESRPVSADEVARAFQDIQRTRGFAITEVARETTAPPSTGAPIPAESSDSRSAPTIARAVVTDTHESAASMTVARPIAPEERYPPTSDEPSGDEEPRSVATKWLAVGGAVVALVVALVFWAVVSSGGEQVTATTAGDFGQTDDLFDQPIIPTGVTAEFVTTDTVSVTWSEIGVRDGDTFRVRRVDAGAPDDSIVIVDRPPATFDGVASPSPCFEIVMVRGGRISPPSQSVCTTR